MLNTYHICPSNKVRHALWWYSVWPGRGQIWPLAWLSYGNIPMYILLKCFGLLFNLHEYLFPNGIPWKNELYPIKSTKRVTVTYLNNWSEPVTQRAYRLHMVLQSKFVQPKFTDGHQNMGDHWAKNKKANELLLVEIYLKCVLKLYTLKVFMEVRVIQY